MKNEPKSGVLFLAICSLTKESGGKPEYDDGRGIAAALPDFRDRLLKRREEVRQLVKGTTALVWQGVPLSQLSYNHDLTKGLDFGGRHTAAYLPALGRYEGRFFQALGTEGRNKLGQSEHHVLFLSGLYGLLRPLESVQLYSCPLASEVTEIWKRETFLTDLLWGYIKKNNIVRVFDMTALDAYRNLIDWQKIEALGIDVLHCFSEMAAGDFALTFFGKTLASGFLDLSEDELLDLSSDMKVKDVTLWKQAKAPSGFPEEISSILQAYEEKDILQPWSPSSVDVLEVLHGGNPNLERDNEVTAGGNGDDWKFTISSNFFKHASRIHNLHSKVMETILKICKNPLSMHGNTIKPLKRELKGYWRYRFDGNRLIYFPNKKRRIVHLLDVGPRGSIYERYE